MNAVAIAEIIAALAPVAMKMGVGIADLINTIREELDTNDKIIAALEKAEAEGFPALDFERDSQR